MKNTNYFKQKLEELSNLLTTVDLGQNLFDEATEYFDILDSKSSTEQEKHNTCALIENLIARTKDFPKYEKPTDKIIKYIESNNDLDDKTILLLNKYIGILNDPDANIKLKVETWKNYKMIIENIKKENLINDAIEFINNGDIQDKEMILNLIELLKTSKDVDEKNAAFIWLEKILKNNSYSKKRG